MIITTWNVLHHVHATNWGEIPVALDEPARIEALARRVHKFVGVSLAVCLQEVSGDQLRALQAPHVFSFALPRVPYVRSGPDTLSDATEHLVVLSSLLPGRVLEQRAFPTDPGKGFIAVRLDNGVVIISTHISHGERSAAQLDELAGWVRAQETGPMVIAGDFNAERHSVHAALGPGFSVSLLPEGSRPSRPRPEDTKKSQDIDHVFGYLATPVESGVEDGQGLSDHNPTWSKFA